jgi:hypothetical protein
MLEKTHVESPMEKYVLHVITVTQGRNASHMIATATARTAKSIAKNDCCATRRRRSTGGNLVGISVA